MISRANELCYMKRRLSLLDNNQAACDFFALPESTALLMGACEGDPRIVALLLQLCVQKRADVWLWLAETAATPTNWGERLARITWHRNLLERLCRDVSPHMLTNNHDWTHNHGMFRPVLWAPCKHWASGKLYLGLYHCAYDIGSSENESDEGNEDKDEEEPISYGDFDGCNSLVAHEGWWGATWQPVCCFTQQALHWDFVGSALLHRHNALTALYAQNAHRTVAQYKESKHWRKMLFNGGPTYQQS